MARSIKETLQMVNANLKTLDKEYGSGSRIVEDYRRTLELAAGPGSTYINAKGQLAVHNTKAVREALSEAENGLAAVGDLPTATDYRLELKRAWFEEQAAKGDEDFRQPTKEELKDFARMRDEVMQASEDGRLQQILSDQKAKGSRIPGNLTYEDLMGALNGQDVGKSIEEEFGDLMSEFPEEWGSSEGLSIGPGGGDLKHAGESIIRL